MTGLIMTLDELAPLPHWVAWQQELRAGSAKPTKVPYSPRGFGHAKADDPNTWGTRDAAQRRAETLEKPFGMGGVGFELGPIGDGMSVGGIDLDSCLNTVTGKIAPWADRVIGRFCSYTEVSPSGTGVKVFFLYEDSDADEIREHFKMSATTGERQWGAKWSAANDAGHPPAIELYLNQRYFAVTYQQWRTSAAELRAQSIEDILWLVREAGPAFERDVGKKAASGPEFDWTAAGAHAHNGSAGPHRGARNGAAGEAPPDPLDTPEARALWQRIHAAAAFRPALARRLAGDWTMRGADQSRSARALSFARLTVGPLSLSFDQFALMMRSHPEGFIRAWAAEKPREIQRTYAACLVGTDWRPPPGGEGQRPHGGGEPGEEAPAPEDDGLSLIDPTTLAGTDPKPREWIVSEAVPVGQTTMLYGDGGVGKSLCALQLQCCTALGRPWLGMNATPCRSVGFYCEDDADELHRRADAICRMEGGSLADLGDCRWVSRVGGENELVLFDHEGRMTLTPIWEQLLMAALDFGARLVVLDGAQDTFSGNENVRIQVRRFIQGACTRIARAIGGAVVLLAHPSRDGLRTGNLDGASTGWNNSARARITLARVESDGEAEADENLRVLKIAKANYGARNSEGVKIRWRQGAFVLEEELTPTVRRIREENVDKVFLRLLDRILAQGRRVNMTANNQGYAPKVFALQPERDGCTKADFEGAMNRLLNAGTIRLGSVMDEHRHPRQTLMRTSQARAENEAA